MSSLLKGAATAATTATTAADATTTTAETLSEDLAKLLANLKGESQQVLHVYSYNSQTRVIKEKACIPFKNGDTTKMRLSDVRELLVSEKILEPRLLWSTFCNQRGAKVLDTTSFQSYLDILNEKSSEAGEIEVDNADIYRVYLKSEKVVDQDFLRDVLQRGGGKATVDNKIAGVPTAEQPKPAELPTSFSHNIFINPTTTFSIVHAADMSEKHWSVVLRNNSLLNAYQVVEVDEKVGKVVERSMHTAFVLKPRLFLNYQISVSAASDYVAKQKQMLRVPRFRIEDDSYIEQFEKTKAVSRAIAQSSLSQVAAEMAVGGGAFGFSASASASYAEDNSSSSASSSSEDTRVMTITYNFPRVVIDLDHHSLDLTEECKADLLSVKSSADISSFKDKYGRFFPTRVQLGGRLHASEDSTATTSTAKADQAKAMRSAAALSFSSPYVQASAKMSADKSSTSSSDESSSAATKSICWEAKGGDTLLCNDPTAWAYTVGSFYNWRAVKQSRVLAVEDVISTIPGYQYIKQKFADILKSEQPVLTTVSVGFQIGYAANSKLLTVNPSVAEAEDFSLSYETSIVAGAGAVAMTAERYDYLQKLNSVTSYALPTGLIASDKSDSQKFYVNVETVQGNEVKQLKYNHPYHIYNNSDDKTTSWLISTPSLQGYISTSLIYVGKSHLATSFQFRSTTVGDKSEYIKSGSTVYITMLDHYGAEIGSASYQPSMGDRVGVDYNNYGHTQAHIFTVTYI
ncbi:hypothetical protein BO94DRAFT_624296 [Aspergillus sclerotioniger CBS 115572]|uniref:MACPF-like domain-containing protein n=1 Tax=Aspergillus sclerotioniger CBS 115572 TaxID=1450535 RepID=A0A317WSB3_9EURO|nr:hypothetical protein BO94DRAFT_624296 [Aspergillus sclerotioniger CBS 115572]PWY87080.1 hypothetical protein BO94DRAFT_624296 [Aspergillus sclerotioniger CBS 115572]